MDCVKSSTVLHWNYRGFTKFPIEHLRGEEGDVTDIYLKENLISRVPNDIGKLRNLESLYLTGNDITELPREISHLQRLKCLDVSGNRLRGVPDEIGELRELKFLILDENELRELPLRISELRSLRYLSVCDNKLQWLPQRPVYNYFHCEFRFWRNPDLKTIPYSLWYHMFREQQTRSLNIGCLNIIENQLVTKNVTCRITINQECREYEIDINCPPQHKNIVETGRNSPPSLYELTKRVAYEMILTTVKQYATNFSVHSERNNYYLEYNKSSALTNLEKTFDNFGIDNNVETCFDLNKNQEPGNCQYSYRKSERRNYYVPKDIIEKFYMCLPYFIKLELSNGPISKCDNAYCKKAIFDYVIYEFCTEKITLIDSTEDVILNANFCSKSCADFWKLGKQNTISWRYSKVYEAKEGEVKTDASHGYFEGHKCLLSPDKISTYEIQCNPFRKFILNLTSVHAGDVRAKNMFRSYAALCMERQRQCRHYPFSIHPFSRVRLWMEALFVVIMLLSNIGIAVLISKTEPDVHDYFSIAVKSLDFFYLFNVFFNFFTGYIEGNTCQRVVLDLRKIAKKYIGTWLIVDVTSSISCLDLFYESRNVIVYLVMGSLKILRMLTLYIYVKNLLTVLKIKMLSRTLVESSLFILSYLTWNVYFQFMVEFMQEQSYQPEHPRNCSWLTIGKLWNQTSTTRFVYSFDRAVGMLRGNANLNLLKTEGCFENFFMVAWVIAKIIVLHCAFKYIIALFGSESARAKYFMMQQQIETYMNQRKYPSNIKKKIIKFYSLRFQSHFFVESRMMSCVSGQLREDLIMYSGRQLMRDVAFLKHIPRALLLEVGLRLQMVLFIAGDVIMKINTIGDCMFFIDKGTVAIYSESGREVCHLEDGDFFGDIALTMKHKLRTATAVAVTNCELFKLNKEDFDSTIACYPTVYEEIEKVAASRLERTHVLDEHHKAEIKMLNDYENM